MTNLRKVLASLCGLVVWATGALAQDTPASGGRGPLQTVAEPSAPTADQPTWVTRCVASTRQSALECAIEVRLFVSGTSQLVAVVTVRVPADTKKPVMMIQTPLGLFLPAGVTINVDGANPQRFDLQTCDAGGCYAGSPLADEFLAGMSKGQKLNVNFQGLNKQSISVPVTLIGFTSAYQSIR